MSDTPSLAFVDVRGGMNAFDPPHLIAPNQVSRMVNCQLWQGLPTTRFGVMGIPISGAEEAGLDRTSNNQGSIFFNPAKGQGGIALADSNPMLAVAFGGRKYSTTIQGRRERTKATVKDISGGKLTAGRLHMVWWLGAEDILLANDGQSPAWTWTPSDGAEFSPGYNTTDKLKSRIPNGGTVCAYAHSRLVQVVNSNVILVGDNLHRTDQSSSRNLKDFVEQVYWATGQYFLPPTAIGNILAAEMLASTGDTNNGYAGLVFYCEDGIFFLDLNIYPRTDWPVKPMVKTALETPGATGFYAVTNYNGDHYFRAPKGLMSLKWAINTNSGESPIRSLSSEVDCWLSGDYHRWLRFASVERWDAMQRLFVTVNPVVMGRWRWHRGMVVRNMNVSPVDRNEPGAWEGLWTLHPESCGVVQFVNGMFDGEERHFAWTRGMDGVNRLVEFTDWLREDVKEDGTRVAIPCQVTTRAIDAGKAWETREYSTGRLYLRGIKGTVKWGVWVRSSENPAWTFWKAGVVKNEESSACELVESEEATRMFRLGAVPKAAFGTCAGGNGKSESRWMQCLVRWVGWCSLENIRVQFSGKDTKDDVAAKGEYDVVIPPASACGYNDFEYCEQETPEWAAELKPSCL